MKKANLVLVILAALLAADNLYAEGRKTAPVVIKKDFKTMITPDMAGIKSIRKVADIFSSACGDGFVLANPKYLSLAPAVSCDLQKQFICQSWKDFPEKACPKCSHCESIKQGYMGLGYECYSLNEISQSEVECPSGFHLPTVNELYHIYFTNLDVKLEDKAVMVCFKFDGPICLKALWLFGCFADAPDTDLLQKACGKNSLVNIISPKSVCCEEKAE